MSFKNIAILILVTLFCPSILATKYVTLKMEDKVQQSMIIVLGEIKSLMCLDENGQKVKAGRKCTAPGLKSALHYEIKPLVVYKDENGYVDNLGRDSIIKLKVRSRAHWSVPADEYASYIGKKQLYYMYTVQDKLYPTHEAFFKDDTRRTKELLKTLARRQMLAKVIDYYTLIEAEGAPKVCTATNWKIIKALESYKSCTNDTPYETSSGSCTRKEDGATARFFWDKEDCEKAS